MKLRAWRSVKEMIASMLAGIKYTRQDLHEYQEEAVNFLLENSFSALFIDMGLGKTVSSLTVIAELIRQNINSKILIIAPIKVATDTWPNEIAQWEQAAWLSYQVLRVDDDDPRFAEVRRKTRASARAEGLSSEHVNALVNRMQTVEKWRIMGEMTRDTRASVHIINREAVDWLVHFWKDEWPYRTVIIDESSSFKDHQSDRFKALAKVRRTPGLITRLHLLTATPAAEGYIGLFPQIYLLDRGERLGKNITAYRKSYFTQNRYSFKWEIRPGAEEKILSLISDICLVMKAKDYLSRKEPTFIRHSVKLSDQQKKLIKDLEKTFILTLPDGTEIEAKTAAMLASMLLQMASGSVYETLLVEDYETTDMKKIKKVHDLHNHKIETLREIAEEAANQGEPLLVSYHFQSSLAKLKKAFPKAVVMDKAGKAIKDWNKRKIPMLLIHPQSDAYGLNLQHGGSTLVLYDLIYSLEKYLQLIGRIDRQGQLNPVLVHLLVAEGTRDELVAASVLAKEDAQDKMFALLNRLIRKYRKQKLAEAAARELAEEEL